METELNLLSPPATPPLGLSKVSFIDPIQVELMFVINVNFIERFGEKNIFFCHKNKQRKHFILLFMDQSKIRKDLEKFPLNQINLSQPMQKKSTHRPKYKTFFYF